MDLPRIRRRTALLLAAPALALLLGACTVTFDPAPVTIQGRAVATSKDACKDGGWRGLVRADGSSFRNQGTCVRYVNTGR